MCNWNIVIAIGFGISVANLVSIAFGLRGVGPLVISIVGFVFVFGGIAMDMRKKLKQ